MIQNGMKVDDNGLFTLWCLNQQRGATPEGARGALVLSENRSDIIDWVHFEKSRAELGPGFIRILSYFREDGIKSVAQIEDAMRQHDTVALIIPSHTLKGEARQFGAEP